MGRRQWYRRWTRARWLAGPTCRGLLECHVHGGAPPVRRDSCRRSGGGEILVSSAFGVAVVLRGSSVTALVVGGGDVATRKAVALLDGGASVRVRAPIVNPTLLQRAASDEPLLIAQRPYDQSAIADATPLVSAAANRPVNPRPG